VKNKKSEINEKLLRLLRSNENDPVATSCMALILDGHEIRQKSLRNSIPIKKVIDIYSVRETINSSRGGSIKGCDRLLPNLNSASASHIMIHSLEFEFDSFVVFTDEAIENMFGILYLPKKNKGWYNLEETLHD